MGNFSSWARMIYFWFAISWKGAICSAIRERWEKFKYFPETFIFVPSRKKPSFLVIFTSIPEKIFSPLCFSVMTGKQEKIFEWYTSMWVENRMKIIITLYWKPHCEKREIFFHYIFCFKRNFIHFSIYLFF